MQAQDRQSGRVRSIDNYVTRDEANSYSVLVTRQTLSTNNTLKGLVKVCFRIRGWEDG